MLALGFQREVHDHDAVLLDNADEQDDADDGDDAEVLAEEHEREQGAHAGRGERGKNGDGVNEALVQNAEHDIDRHQRGQDEQSLIGEGAPIDGRRALDAGHAADSAGGSGEHAGGGRVLRR